MIFVFLSNPTHCIESESCSVVSDSLWPHGIAQARTLEWGAFPFSRGSSQPRDRTQVSCIAGGFFTSWATREAQEYWSGWPIPSPADVLNPGIELGSPVLQADSLPTELLGKPTYCFKCPLFSTSLPIFVICSLFDNFHGLRGALSIRLEFTDWVFNQMLFWWATMNINVSRWYRIIKSVCSRSLSSIHLTFYSFGGITTVMQFKIIFPANLSV